MKKGILLFLLFVFASSAAGQERYVRPVDEAAKDASFLAFRTKLIAAAEKKDAKFILSIVDKNIRNGFGGDDGIENFTETWELEKPESKFWGEFLPVIKNGGSFSPPARGTGKTFMAPWSFSKWPDDLDAFDTLVIFGNNVNLRETPGAGGRIVGKLSYNAVRMVENAKTPENSDESEWVKIRTLGGKTGWVKSEYVRSPIDYRAGFEKTGGKWKMTFFVAGD